MKSFILILLFMNISCENENITVIVMNTDFGSIYIKLQTEKAPVTCNNFLKYIDF